MQLRKKRINKNDSTIFANLFKARRPLPIKRIATRTGLSWPTTRDHVKKLQEFGILDIQKSKRRNNVSINQNYLNDLKRRRKIKIGP